MQAVEAEKEQIYMHININKNSETTHSEK